MGAADMTARVLADIGDGLVYRIPGSDRVPDSYRLDDNTRVERGEYAYYLDALRQVSDAGLVEATSYRVAGAYRLRLTAAGRLLSTLTLVGVA